MVLSFNILVCYLRFLAHAEECTLFVFGAFLGRRLASPEAVGDDHDTMEWYRRYVYVDEWSL